MFDRHLTDLSERQDVSDKDLKHTHITTLDKTPDRSSKLFGQFILGVGRA